MPHLLRIPLWPPLLFLGVLVVCVIATDVGAQTCVDDVTGRSNNCTASDVAISQIEVLSVIDGCTSSADTATLQLRARVVAGAAARYDIGMFFALDGGDAFTGNCLQEYLPPPLLGLGAYDPTSGTGPYLTLEPVGDTCGDVEQGVETFRNLGQVTLPCTDSDHDGKVDLGTCVSWDNNVIGNCTSSAQAIPGTAAKCRCRAPGRAAHDPDADAEPAHRRRHSARRPRGRRPRRPRSRPRPRQSRLAPPPSPRHRPRRRLRTRAPSPATRDRNADSHRHRRPRHRRATPTRTDDATATTTPTRTATPTATATRRRRAPPRRPPRPPQPQRRSRRPTRRP